MSRQASALVEKKPEMFGKKQEGLEQRPVRSIDELRNYDQQRELDRQNNQYLTKQAMHKKESLSTERKSSLRGAARAGNQPEPVARGLSTGSGLGIGLGSFTNAGPGSQPHQQLTNSDAIRNL